MDKVEKIMERWNSLLPLSERDREMLSRRFTIDFNYNSNHIEGNTLTYGQTEILLLLGEAEVRDVQEMTASNVGLKMMTEEAAVKDVPLTQILSVHFIRHYYVRIIRYIGICLVDRLQVIPYMQVNIRLAPIVLLPDMVTDSNMLRPKRLPR